MVRVKRLLDKLNNERLFFLLNISLIEGTRAAANSKMLAKIFSLI